jgi:hypothetical protein
MISIIITMTLLSLQLSSVSSYVPQLQAYRISRDGEAKLDCNVICIVKSILICIFLLFFFVLTVIVLWDCYMRKIRK